MMKAWPSSLFSRTASTSSPFDSSPARPKGFSMQRWKTVPAPSTSPCGLQCATSSVLSGWFAASTGNRWHLY